MPKTKVSYNHTRVGDTVHVEIRDFTRRKLYKKIFNVNDRRALLDLLSAMEKYAEFSVYGVLKEKLKDGYWW